MLSALITIKSKNKTSEIIPCITPSIVPSIVPKERKKRQSKQDSIIKAQKTPKIPKIPKEKPAKVVKNKKKIEPYEEKDDVDNGVFSSFVPIDKKSSKTKEPKPWDIDDDVLEGGEVHFDTDEEKEDENDKYKRQDKEWNEIMKDEEDKFGDMNADDTSSDFSADTLSEMGDDVRSVSDVSDVSDVHSDTESVLLDDDNVFLDDDIVCDSDDEYTGDVFFSLPKTKRETYKEKKQKVYTGADIMFDDEFIP